MIAINEQQKREKRERIIAREAEIAKNLEKLENWKNDITMRREKKEKVKFLSPLRGSLLNCFLYFRTHVSLRIVKID